MTEETQGRSLFTAATLAMVALLALTGSVILRIHDQNQIDRIARETHTAVCAFKIDTQGRLRDQERYLRQLQDGSRPPIQGITQADIELAISNRKSTLLSLKHLDCKKEET